MDEHTVAAAVLIGPDAIIAADRNGTITFWNAGAERIFGYSRAHALGQSLDLIIPERLRGRHWTGWNDVMATGRSNYGEGDLLSVPGTRRDGSSVSVEFTIHPIHGPDGELIGIAATLRDITDRFNELRALRKQVTEPNPSC